MTQSYGSKGQEPTIAERIDNVNTLIHDRRAAEDQLQAAFSLPAPLAQAKNPQRLIHEVNQMGVGERQNPMEISETQAAGLDITSAIRTSNFFYYLIFLF